MVERCLAKANVASSNLVFRSKFNSRSLRAAHIIISWHHSQAVRQGPAKPLPPVRVRVVPPISPLPAACTVIIMGFFICPSGGTGRRPGLKIRCVSPAFFFIFALFLLYIVCKTHRQHYKMYKFSHFSRKILASCKNYLIHAAVSE